MDDRPDIGRQPELIGRAGELAMITQLLADPDTRLMTVTGVPGVGKTRLVVELCSIARRELGRRVVFVSLAQIHDPDAILVAVSMARSASMATPDSALARELVVLDNIEQLPGADEQIGRLLIESSSVQVIATSTARVGLDGERVLRLGGLPHDASGAAHPADVELFARRAAAADIRFRLTDDNISDVAALCALLGGLPLAIELAAAHAAELSPAALLAQFQDGAGLDLLRTGRGRAPRRHRSMRQALQWSYRSLSDHAQRLLADLSVFAGPFPLAAVAAVTAVEHFGVGEDIGADIEAGELYDLLSVLVDARLVEPCYDAVDEVRYELLPLVRLFADEQQAAQRRVAIAERYRDFVCESTRQAGQWFEEGKHGAALRRLEAQWPDITVVLSQLAAGPDRRAGLQLAVDAAPYLAAVGYETSWRTGLERLLALVGHGEIAPTLHARALLWSVLLARQDVDPAAHRAWARNRLTEAISLARSCGDDRTVLLGLEMVALTFPLIADLPAAWEAISEGLALAETLGDEPATARFEAFASMAEHQHGKLGSAREYALRALRRGRRSGDAKAVIQAALAILGLPATELPRLPPELPAMADLRALCRELHELQTETYLLGVDAMRQVSRGTLVEASQRCAEALIMVRGMGGTGTIASALVISTLLLAAARRRHYETVADLHGAIQRFGPVVDAASPPWKIAAYRWAVGAARSALGDDRFTVRIAASAGWSAEAAISVALSYARSALSPQQPAPQQPTSQPLSERPTSMSGPSRPTASLAPESLTAASLTARERDVLLLLATGATNKMIAGHLGLTAKTVTHYSSAVYQKLGVRGRAEATAWAYRNGMIVT